MPELNFFDSMQHLEPKCPNCKIVIDYGVNTKYNQKIGKHVCMNCGEVLK